MRIRMGIQKKLCAVVLLLSMLQSTTMYAEERVYGITEYGPVSVNGNGVGRGQDPTYQYIEDLLYNRQGSSTPSGETQRPEPLLRLQIPVHRITAGQIQLRPRRENGIWRSFRKADRQRQLVPK